MNNCWFLYSLYRYTGLQANFFGRRTLYSLVENIHLWSIHLQNQMYSIIFNSNWRRRCRNISYIILFERKLSHMVLLAKVDINRLREHSLASMLYRVTTGSYLLSKVQLQCQESYPVTWSPLFKWLRSLVWDPQDPKWRLSASYSDHRSSVAWSRCPHTLETHRVFTFDLQEVGKYVSASGLCNLVSWWLLVPPTSIQARIWQRHLALPHI